MVARLCDDFQVSHLAEKNQNQTARTGANSEDAEEMFVPRPLAKGQCMLGVGSNK